MKFYKTKHIFKYEIKQQFNGTSTQKTIDSEKFKELIII